MIRYLGCPELSSTSSASLRLSSPELRSGRGPLLSSWSSDGVLADKQQLQQPGALDEEEEEVEGVGAESLGISPVPARLPPSQSSPVRARSINIKTRWSPAWICRIRDTAMQVGSHAPRHCLSPQRPQSEQLVFIVSTGPVSWPCGKIHFGASLS